jgi:hypothetical protein
MIGQQWRPGIRRAVSVLALLALGSCGSVGDPEGVSNTENACAIVREQPDWWAAALATEARWGLPPEVLFAIIWRESSFRGDARTPRTYFLGVVPTGRVSTAYGYAQAIDGTWDWYRDETGNGGAERDEFRDAADFVGWYTRKTERMNGVPQTDAFNQYLAYHEGHQGYASGKWRSKDWLIGAADAVRRQSVRYREQLAACA